MSAAGSSIIRGASLWLAASAGAGTKDASVAASPTMTRALGTSGSIMVVFLLENGVKPPATRRPRCPSFTLLYAGGAPSGLIRDGRQRGPERPSLRPPRAPV